MKNITSYWIKNPVSSVYDLYEEVSYDFCDTSELYINGILQSKKAMLELGKNELFGVTYYTIYVNGRTLYGDYTVWEDMIGWAVDTFGPSEQAGPSTIGQRWYVNNATFWFKEEQDREWFLLRWS